MKIRVLFIEYELKVVEKEINRGIVVGDRK